MKIGRYFLVAAPIVVGLLLTVGPVWADTMAHYGNSSCVHPPIPGPTHVGTSYTFNLCVGDSHADTWTAYVQNYVTKAILPCGVTNQPVPPNGTTSFTCNSIPAGTYRGYIVFWVSTSQFTHIDYYYVAP